MHPVRKAVSRGSPWFYAWYSQACTPWALIQRRAKISLSRLHEFERGSLPAAAEIEALALLWGCPADQIEASLGE